MLTWAKILFSSIVDYAGLFPPAKLNLQQVMVNYNRYRLADQSWMLGNLVLPISRLQEFETLLPIFPSEAEQTKFWPLSLIVNEPLESAIAKVQSLNKNNKIAIAALEFPLLSPREIERFLPLLPTEIETYFEIPCSGDLKEYLSVLKETKTSAKVRTGGLKAEAFPTVEQLGQFIWDCAKTGISFKATAGLHHLLPGQYPLTKNQGTSTAAMHGFMNVAVSAAFVYWQKLTFPELLTVLQESSLDNFQFNTQGIHWCDRPLGRRALPERLLNLSELEAARKHFFRSFGSCSFQEPVDELIELLE